MKKHILYFNPDKERLNFEKPFDIKNLPGKIHNYGRCKMTIEKFIPLKTNKQLRYYRGAILPYLEKELMNKTFYTREEWHTFLKDKFGVKKTLRQFMDERDINIPEEDFRQILREKYKLNDHQLAEKLNFLLSHSKYTEKQMSIFINQVVEWVLHFFNLQIPPATAIEEYI